MNLFSQNQQLILSQLSILDAVLRMGCSLSLALASGLVYSMVKSGLESRNQVIYGGVSVCLIVTMILLVLGENLVYALGLFAALSIIRFRTPVKSIYDITHLFLCIGIGIACGSGAVKIAVVGTVFILSVHFAYHRLRFDRVDIGCILKVKFGPHQTHTEDFDQLLGTLCSSFSTSQVHRLSTGKTEHMYQVFPRKNTSFEKIISSASSHPGVEEALLFTTQTPVDIQ